MRLYRMATGAFINLDMVAYIELFDSYADVYVSGRANPVRVADTDYARLVTWLKATADPTNQPLAQNQPNPAAVPAYLPAVVTPGVLTPVPQATGGFSGNT